MCYEYTKYVIWGAQSSEAIAKSCKRCSLFCILVHRKWMYIMMDMKYWKA